MRFPPILRTGGRRRRAAGGGQLVDRAGVPKKVPRGGLFGLPAPPAAAPRLAGVSRGVLAPPRFFCGSWRFLGRWPGSPAGSRGGLLGPGGGLVGTAFPGLALHGYLISVRCCPLRGVS